MGAPCQIITYKKASVDAISAEETITIFLTTGGFPPRGSVAAVRYNMQIAHHTKWHTTLKHSTQNCTKNRGSCMQRINGNTVNKKLSLVNSNSIEICIVINWTVAHTFHSDLPFIPLHYICVILVTRLYRTSFFLVPPHLHYHLSLSWNYLVYRIESIKHLHCIKLFPNSCLFPELCPKADNLVVLSLRLMKQMAFTLRLIFISFSEAPLSGQFR